MEKLNVKQEGLSALYGIGYSILIISIIIIFKLNIYQIWGLSVLGSAILLYKSKPYLQKLLKSTLWITGIMVFIHIFQKFVKIEAYASYIILTLTLTIMMLIRRRKKFIAVKHHIEAMLWGKPLKEFKGKPPKLFN